MKKTFKMALLFAVVALASCGGNDSSKSQGDVKVEGWQDEETTYAKRYVKPSEIKPGENNFHTAVQQAYIESSWDMVSKFAKGEAELSLPDVTKIDISGEESKTYIQIATDPEFSDARVFLPNDENTLGFYNLLLGTKYYWRCGDSFDFSSSVVHEFVTTSFAPRNLFVDGVTNVRDLGGYSSKLGGKIRQGLFYRGGALTRGSSSPTSLMSEKGYKTLSKTLGVKTEIDMRMTLSKNENPENGNMDDSMFKEIRYVSVPIDWHSDNMMLDRKEEIRDIFKTYAVEENYPIYLHCSIGTDRTGLVSYLMGALLGIHYDDLYKDYLFSNFGAIGSSRDESAIIKYQNTLKSYKKKTLAECAEAYLTDIGLTAAEVASIRETMIEK